MSTLLATLMLAAMSAMGVEQSAVQAFDQLKPLAGKWQGQTDGGHTIRIDYALTSRDSVFVESWQPGTSAATLSIIHRDGDRLLATHYCGQGNQPRLALQHAEENRLAFEFVDATNLATATASHLHRLEFIVKSDGSLERIETYRSGDEEEVSRVELRRLNDESGAGSRGP
ncbi:hypothetical protein [Dokdonella sp.]|uniref:hypothetical protein n=1 Tax=Dokdonella sp. TaxID=2291710 RepID=UPI003C64ECD5